jgi:hypothetical protein
MYVVSKDLLQKIADCESEFNTNATNGDYAGMFQYSTLAWKAARGRIGLDSNPSLRFNAEESIKTAAHEIQTRGTSSWPNCD